MNQVTELLSLIDSKYYFLNNTGMILAIIYIFIICRKIKLGKKPARFLDAVFIGLLVWTALLFMLLSLNISIYDEIVRLSISLFISIIAIYFVLKEARGFEPLTIRRFFLLVLSFTFLLLLGEGVLYIIIFKDFIALHSTLIIITFFLTLGIVSAALRLFYQINSELLHKRAMFLSIIGGIFTGLGVAGIPYMIFIALVNFESFSSNPSLIRETILIPFALELLYLFILGIIPSTFGEMKLSEEKEKLSISTQQYESLFKLNPSGVILVDKSGYIKSANQTAINLLGYSSEELIDQKFDIITGGNHHTLYNNVLEGIYSEQHKRIETSLYTRNKQEIIVDLTIIPIIVKNDVIGVYGMFKDITLEKTNKELVHFLAYHDDLTHLPNRRFLIEEVSSLVDAKTRFTIYSLDFDQFKIVNDIYGHHVGDLIICEIADRFITNLPKNCRIARMGGDEFAILLPEVTNCEQVESLAKQILSLFDKPIHVSNIEWNLTTSIGIATYPKDGDKTDVVFKSSDIALYRSKSNGTNGYEFYSEELNQEIIEFAFLEQELKKAIENETIQIFFQPKYNAKSESFVGVESLARWTLEERGVISPSTFIPIAEKSGLIVQLDQYILKKACIQFKSLIEEGYDLKGLSVNFSQLLFYHDHIVDFVLETLKAAELSPVQLEIEITETIAMYNTAYTLNILNELKSHGIRISLDDFGTGYSSISYLKVLPIDCLKIDKSFINDLIVDKQSDALVITLISMANILEIDVIAEGVETIEQAEFLFKHHCYDIQGYLYSRPLPLEEMRTLLQKGSSRHIV